MIAARGCQSAGASCHTIAGVDADRTQRDPLGSAAIWRWLRYSSRRCSSNRMRKAGLADGLIPTMRSTNWSRRSVGAGSAAGEEEEAICSKRSPTNVWLHG